MHCSVLAGQALRPALRDYSQRQNYLYPLTLRRQKKIKAGMRQMRKKQRTLKSSLRDFLIALTKEKIRSKILARLIKQKEEERRRKSLLIQKKLFKEKAFKDAKRIMFYVALKGEVETKQMIEDALKLGKTIAVPVCMKHKKTLRACLLDSYLHLRKGPYGVWEPAGSRFIAFKKLDLVIVPGVAFDKQGNRLGRGKGYYDRFLKKLPRDIPTIGLAYKKQILPYLPTTPFDVRVSKVLFA